MFLLLNCLPFVYVYVLLIDLKNGVLRGGLPLQLDFYLHMFFHNFPLLLHTSASALHDQ
jgi:hypothetical protein